MILRSISVRSPKDERCQLDVDDKVILDMRCMLL